MYFKFTMFSCKGNVMFQPSVVGLSRIITGYSCILFPYTLVNFKGSSTLEVTPFQKCLKIASLNHFKFILYFNELLQAMIIVLHRQFPALYLFSEPIFLFIVVELSSENIVPICRYFLSCKIPQTGLQCNAIWIQFKEVLGEKLTIPQHPDSPRFSV